MSKRLMKAVEEPFPNTIPVEWQVKKVKHIAKVGSSKRVFEDQYKSEGIPFFRSKEVVELANNKEISVDLYIEDDLYRKFLANYNAPKKGDMLITSIGTIGEVWISDGREFYYKDGNITQLSSTKEVEIEFIKYCFQSELFKEQYRLMSAGSTLMALSIEKIKELAIYIPELSEQKRIIEFLKKKNNEISNVIEAKNKLIKLLEQQRQSIITEAVTKGLNPNVKMKDSGVEWIGEIPEHWDLIKIKHLTQVKRGASPRPIDDPKYFDDDGEFAWVRIADVSKAGMYLDETLQVMSELGASLSVKQQPGDLFVSIAGTVGKPCITNIKCCIHDGFVYFPNYKYNTEFLYYIFASGQSYKGLGKMGTQLNLNTDTIGSIKIPWPSEQEQNEIVYKITEEVNQFDKIITMIRTQIEKLQEYRQALIYEAVTGKIDVRDMEFD